MLFGLVAWIFFFGCYLLFAGTMSMTELIAGVPAAAAAAGFAVAVHRSSERRFRLKAPWWRVLGRPVAELLPDAVRVGRVLFRSLLHRPVGSVGVVIRQPFRAGGDDPQAAARRGLVTLGASLAPNGFVLRVPGERVPGGRVPGGQDVLLLHRLAPEPPNADRDWPL